MKITREKIKQFLKVSPFILASLVLIVWLSLQQEGDSIRPSKRINSDAPDLTLMDSVSFHYDETGQLKYQLTAKQIDHYKDADMAYLTEPDLISTTPKPQGQVQWTATSNTGKANLKTDVITLEDQVRITRTSGDQKLTLRTSILDIDTQKNTADNEVLTVLHSGASYVESKGFFSDFNSGETLLKSNVRGTHDVQN